MRKTKDQEDCLTYRMLNFVLKRSRRKHALPYIGANAMFGSSYKALKFLQYKTLHIFLSPFAFNIIDLSITSFGNIK